MSSPPSWRELGKKYVRKLLKTALEMKGEFGLNIGIGLLTSTIALSVSSLVPITADVIYPILFFPTFIVAIPTYLDIPDDEIGKSSVDMVAFESPMSGIATCSGVMSGFLILGIITGTGNLTTVLLFTVISLVFVLGFGLLMGLFMQNGRNKNSVIQNTSSESTSCGDKRDEMTLETDTAK